MTFMIATECFNFKWKLNFTNIFNATVDFVTVWPTSKFVVECLRVLIFYHARLSFHFLSSFWCELELKKHSRKDILWQWRQYSESQFRPMWIWFTHISPEPRKWHFMKSIMCWWIIPKIAKLVPYLIWILTKAREVENEFRKNASSSFLSSKKYHWNSISSDWKWFVIDFFKFLKSVSVFSTTLGNFSKIAMFLALVCEVSFATSNKMLAD